MSRPRIARALALAPTIPTILTILTILAILALSAPRARGAEPVPPWRARYLSVLRHCASASATECRDSLSALRELLPGHPAVAYALARVSMRAGDRDGALRALERCAAMGLALDVARDTTFAPLAADSGFVRLARRLAANATPVARARLVHRFSDPGLLAEALARDEARRRWLVGSIRERRILAVGADGRESDFLAPGEARPWGVFALGVDAKRHRLWAATAATPEMGPLAEGEKGRSALVCYDLDRGTTLRRLELPAPGGSHVLGDLVMGDAGEVYVTDSAGGGVYRVIPGADTIETLLPQGLLSSPQTPVLVPERGLLLIPDYSRGLAALDLATRELRWLTHTAEVATAGIDGLYAWKSALIAIQNGVEPERVIEIAVDRGYERVTGARVLERGSALLGSPNHGLVRNGRFVLIGASGWDRMDDDGHMRDDANARAPALLELPLK